MYKRVVLCARVLFSPLYYINCLVPLLSSLTWIIHSVINARKSPRNCLKRIFGDIWVTHAPYLCWLLARYACRITWIAFFSVYSTVTSNAQSSESQKCKRQSIFSKLHGLFLQKSCWNGVRSGEFFLDMPKISLHGEKCTLDQRIPEFFQKVVNTNM